MHRSEEIRVPVRQNTSSPDGRNRATRNRERSPGQWLGTRRRRLGTTGTRWRFQGEDLARGQRLAAPFGAQLQVRIEGADYYLVQLIQAFDQLHRLVFDLGEDQSHADARVEQQNQAQRLRRRLEIRYLLKDAV